MLQSYALGMSPNESNGTYFQVDMDRIGSSTCSYTQNGNVTTCSRASHHNHTHIYSEISPIMFTGADSKESESIRLKPKSLSNSLK